MNERDSEIISGMLREKGCEIVEDADSADIVFFNTCSVRQHAEDRVVGQLRQLASRRRKDPAFRIGVLGCMAQRHGDMLFKEHPQVDIVVGPSNIFDLADLLAKIDGPEKILAVDNKKRPHGKAGIDQRNGVLSAFVNITYGCDNFCSYCIVPYVRGREVSRPKKDILDEVKLLAARGFKEVTLLGQNVNSYGKGLSSKVTFPDLLEAVNKLKGIERIRFTTSHPKDASSALFRAMKDLDKVCEHLHLPLQSGSDKMLDLMNRKYKYEDYMKKVEQLRKLIPEVGLTTDIIVGFPSEKDRDYNETRKALDQIRFNSAFIFKYSPRPPALSSCLVDDVPEAEKKRRNNELLALQKEISAAAKKELTGSTVEVLVEGKSRMSDRDLMGRARDNTTCVFEGQDDLIGKIVKITVTGSSPGTLKGAIAGA
jgi:tRNA-2-methylthio-N6-dimethylallyladenosine synthase